MYACIHACLKSTYITRIEDTLGCASRLVSASVSKRFAKRKLRSTKSWNASASSAAGPVPYLLQRIVAQMSANTMHDYGCTQT